MNSPGKLLCFSLLLVVPQFVSAAGLPPWQFGMTKEQVASFKQFGPYKTFSNGDLETYNGIYHGRRENVQFFFQDNRLTRIGVYIGETTDRDKAISSFRSAYGILEKDYGSLTVPEIRRGPGSDPLNPEVIAIAAAANAFATGKTEMFPVKQPAETRVSGAITSRNVGGKQWYYIAIFFDPR
jgi:hypothetical protein